MVFALFIRVSFNLRDDLPEKTVCVCVCEFDIKSELFFSFVYSLTQKLFGKRSPAAGVEVKLLPKE